MSGHWKPLPIGTRFGRLVVISRAFPIHKLVHQRGPRSMSASVVQCDCGSPPKTVVNALLRYGNTKSCGCLRQEAGAFHTQRSIYEEQPCRGCGKPTNLPYCGSDCRKRWSAAFENYGITGSELMALWEAQERKCAIGDEPIPPPFSGQSGGRTKASCHVDHNTETGKVRGLLCGYHNLGLGNIEPVIERALIYLQGG